MHTRLAHADARADDFAARAQRAEAEAARLARELDDKEKLIHRAAAKVAKHTRNNKEKKGGKKKKKLERKNLIIYFGQI